jgi:hypothetical protein
MPRSVLLLAAVLLSSLIPRPVVRGQQAAVSAGQRVRVEWSDASRRHRKIGRVLEVRGDSLALTEGAGVRTFAFAGLERVDVRMPRSRGEGAVRAAPIGGIVGLVAGIAVAVAFVRANCAEGEDCGLAYVVGPVYGGMGGAACGGMIGAVAGALFPGRRWQRVR